jgi:site-specific DNA recombinase
MLVIEDELKRAGVSIRYVTLRVGESAEDQLLKNMRGVIAEYDREKIAMRLGRGRRAKAERGLVVGNGVAPYGYRYTRDASGRVAGLEPDPATAPIVRRIFADIISMPLDALCTRLNAEGIPTYFGARHGWANSTLLGILHNPVYLGQTAYGRRDTHKRWRETGAWLASPVTALVDQATWDAAHGALAARKKRRPVRREERQDTYPLRGLLMCAHCGGELACMLNGARSHIRYYQCLRNQPYRARLRGQPTCTLPALLAVPLEARLWEQVAARLLDPVQLQAGLAAARVQHSEADERRRVRLETLDREVTRLRARFDRITDERLDAAPGSESERALRAKADEVEAVIRRLLADRAELAGQPSEGLSEAEAMELVRFAQEVCTGIEHATDADRRRVYELLRLRGKVRLDPEHGVKFGRRHRFAVDWNGLIEVGTGGREYKKVRVVYYSDDYAEWERKYLGTVKISLDGIPMAEPAAVPA